MGERVVVGRATPVEPLDDPGAPGAPSGASANEPLNYGRGDRAGDAWRWSRAWGGAVMESIARLTQMLIAAIGGWRRVFFALGVGCLLGGFGDCIAGYSRADGAFWMFVGGLIIGLTLRVPLNKPN